MKIREIKNLTPHKISLVLDKEVLEICPEEIPLRLEAKTELKDYIEFEEKWIPELTTVFGEPNYIPEKVPGRIYIVSLLCCQAFTDREDFYTVGETVRNAEGQIIGARGLIKNPYFKG